MKAGPRVVIAVGIGYLLGRTKKMRLALMIAAAGASGKLGIGPRQLLQQGYKRLAASPEMNKITESLRGELLDAAKAAAMNAATGRIESLNTRLQDQANLPGKRRSRAAEDEEDVDEARDEDEVQDAEDYDEDEYEEDELEDEEAPQKRSSGNGRQPRARASRSPVRRARR